MPFFHVERKRKEEEEEEEKPDERVGEGPARKDGALVEGKGSACGFWGTKCAVVPRSWRAAGTRDVLLVRKRGENW